MTDLWILKSDGSRLSIFTLFFHHATSFIQTDISLLTDGHRNSSSQPQNSRCQIHISPDSQKGFLFGFGTSLCLVKSIEKSIIYGVEPVKLFYTLFEECI